MKKLLILFSVLLVVFMGVWMFKSKSPNVRPSDDVDSRGNDWWNNGESQLPVADIDWVLDPEIPENYIPVPGADELYMIVGDDGLIEEYRHREKQEDGSWVWSTVNPDIPDNYEPVEGLKNVYKVTKNDGSVMYVEYVRNADDTFAFVEVDETGKRIEPEAPKDEKIPENYIHIGNNIYAVYNEHGVCIGYKQRSSDNNGNYVWTDCEAPVKDDSSKPSEQPNESNTTMPSISQPDISRPDSGNNSPPNNDSSHTDISNPDTTTSKPDTNISNPSNTYTETETIISTETKGGWVITYQTIIYRTYTSDGVLQSTKKEGPTEISRVKATDDNGQAPDKSKIASTLSAELARVNVGLIYEKELANQVLVEINAQRSAAGLPALLMHEGNEAYMLSATRAADMAIYNHTDYDSPMYGTLAEMCSLFKITTSSPSEVLWRTTSEKSATAIATRLQLMGGEVFVNSKYTAIGISIVSKNGYFYISAVMIG